MLKMIDYRYEFDEWLAFEDARQKAPKAYRKKFIGSRGYPHFDTTVNLPDALQRGILQQSFSSEINLKKWKFLPFIRKDQRNRRYRHKVKPGPLRHRDQKKYTHIKSRPIMYASHHDACLFAFIGFIISKPYEEKLLNLNLEKNVIAYRSIKGSNNITYAKTAFDYMKRQNEFACLLIDIKSFFNNVPHATLIESLEKVLDQKLPQELSYILRNIMNYRYAIEDEVIKEMKRLKKPYFVPLGRKYTRICKLEDFNKYIDNKRFIRKNSKKSGFPQGSPISGLLANIFLLDFDSWLKNKLSKHDFGFYQRYSDDMIIICPANKVKDIYDEIKKEFSRLGLSLSTDKTELFIKQGGTIKNQLCLVEPRRVSKRENVQYLGLEWDGKQIVLRPSTIEKRFRPKNKLSPKYWRYHEQAIKKIGQKGVKKQFIKIKRTIKKLSK